MERPARRILDKQRTLSKKNTEGFEMLCKTYESFHALKEGPFAPWFEQILCHSKHEKKEMIKPVSKANTLVQDSRGLLFIKLW